VRDSQDLNSRQEGGFTPLVSAAQNGSVELIQLLLAHGADPRAIWLSNPDTTAIASLL
jgi:ankyrin repeat protein